MRVAVALCCVSVLAAACQLTGGPGAGPSEVRSDGGSDEPRLGAPDDALPSTLDELLTRGLPIAEEWQTEPVLAEVEVDLDEKDRWLGARLTYLAPDADRFLSLVASGGGFSQQRVTLGTLQLQPVTGDGVGEIPKLPEELLSPEALAAADAVSSCAVGRPVTVLYSTGAPYAWDGFAWTEPPRWRATVSDDTAGAVLDVATGEGECLRD